jgi:hypothetical protein
VGGEEGTAVAYDPALPLVIDPTLAWASLLGGSSTEWTFDVAVTPGSLTPSFGSLTPARPGCCPVELLSSTIIYMEVLFCGLHEDQREALLSVHGSVQR